MARPKKCRLVESEPEATYFKPRAMPLAELEEVCLNFEELEAFKLKFMGKLEQEQAAKKMKVSRTTFWRILSCAGEKIADALINGKAIKIEGGTYKLRRG
ncbi:MAG: DUF134 domain-containing protein [Candidatus Diapherotrites archaeon]|uniref:UPF0251 protein JW744_03860 n=1 Tax=Candidatus Iainarchaeum sp. TaxID=3101447 RepID=A0A939C4U9_9ARCH|nr:DUF134 domain-containing protein [Candidatus Diapherotrites archaeon]